MAAYPPFPRIEQALLFHLVKLSTTPQDNRHTQALLQQAIDWPVFFTLANQHRVSALALKQLSAFKDKLDTTTQAEVKKRMLLDIQRNMHKLRTLNPILSALQQAQILCIPLKGMGLSMQLYGDPYLRSGNDIDLLISQTDLNTAHEILTDSGYILVSPPHATTAARLAYLSRFEHSYIFRHTDHGPDIDLHWRLHEIPKISANLLLDHLSGKQLALGNTFFPAVRPEAYLTFLVLHGFRDQWIHLKTLCDVYHCLHNKPSSFDEDLLIDLVTHHGLERALKQALLLTECYLDANIPTKLKALMDTVTLPPLLQIDNTKLMDLPGDVRKQPSATYAYRYLADLKPDITYKFQVIHFFLTANKRHLPAWWPDSLLPFAFLLRLMAALLRPFSLLRARKSQPHSP